MTKYLFLYKNPPPSGQQPSPEQMQEMLAQWQAWKEKFKDQILDLGDGLKPQGKIFKAGQVTDGPTVETNEIIGGFSIVQAATVDEAIAVARECPITHMPDYEIEIREFMGY